VEEHFATLKLRPLDTIQIVFHTGAKKRAKEIGITINDPSHLLKWVGADRGMVTLSDMADIQAKQAELQSLVQQWLAQM
jgi:hypothetical protein